MITLYTIVTFLFFHWAFDFFFQTDQMAIGKSKEYKWLNKHVQVYAIGLALMAIFNCAFFGMSITLMYAWVLFNAAAHFFTDYVTSRASSAIYATNESKHDFFVMIGVDQLIHYVTIFASFVYFTSLEMLALNL